MRSRFGVIGQEAGQPNRCRTASTLLLSAVNCDRRWGECIPRHQGQVGLTENDTPELALHVRVVSLPKHDEIDELDLRRRFRVGQTYELPVQLAATLIIAGYAELADGGHRAEVADFQRARSRHRR